MKKRVADIIAEILIKHNITDLFSVVGGGAMFLMMPLAIMIDCMSFLISMSRLVPLLQKDM